MAIAIMACRKLIGKCAGTGCFKAYNESKKAFEIYKDSKPELASFFYCSGCEKTKLKDENWNHKIAQLKKNKVDTIHLALCVNVECNQYERYEEMFEKEGFKVVRGSH